MFWELFLGFLTSFTPLSSSPLPADLVPVVDSASVSGFAPQRLPFSVRFGEDENDFRVIARFVLPNQQVPIAVDIVPRAPEAALEYQLTAGAGRTERTAAGGWTWTAPSRPGLVPIEIHDTESGRTMTLNVFVMVPYSAMRGGRIHGYRIGRYPRTRLGYEDEYERPRGFVEVRPELLDTEVSPHFRLAQFLCKQPGSPEYLVLQPGLLVKLEQLLAAVNDAGFPASTLSVMSAYRTPFYNLAIGNLTTFSRHQYGDAADVFVDVDGDGRMDDLNRDGRHTLADALALRSLVDDGSSPGGIGTYAPTHEHGPFVHVDVRGFDVEWGS